MMSLARIHRTSSLFLDKILIVTSSSVEYFRNGEREKRGAPGKQVGRGSCSRDSSFSRTFDGSKHEALKWTPFQITSVVFHENEVKQYGTEVRRTCPSSVEDLVLYSRRYRCDTLCLTSTSMTASVSIHRWWFRALLLIVDIVFTAFCVLGRRRDRQLQWIDERHQNTCLRKSETDIVFARRPCLRASLRTLAKSSRITREVSMPEFRRTQQSVVLAYGAVRKACQGNSCYYAFHASRPEGENLS